MNGTASSAYGRSRCCASSSRPRIEQARRSRPGLAAVAGEPLRESAYRAIVRVHLADRERGEAVRVYRLYRRVLLEQLGAEPSPLMEEL